MGRCYLKCKCNLRIGIQRVERRGWGGETGDEYLESHSPERTLMKSDPDKRTTPRPTWPWWEPYVFTAGILAMVAMFLIVGGYLLPVVSSYLEANDLGDHIFLILTSLTLVLEAVRKSTRAPSLTGCVFCTVLTALFSLSYWSRDETYFGVGFGLLTATGIGLSVRAALIRTRLRVEQAEKIKQASETMRRVFGDDT
tara:strand:+ start:111 stop:701 length:591 start_codon:yes stop_codon:yes gene_type:complete